MLKQLMILHINLVNLLKYHVRFLTSFHFYSEGVRIQDNAYLITYALWGLQLKVILTISTRFTHIVTMTFFNASYISTDEQYNQSQNICCRLMATTLCEELPENPGLRTEVWGK